MTSPSRLAVWGDPIDHSRSPDLHNAAYRLLGLDWEYGRRQVDEAGFDEALDSLDATWRGLSLTMPLKERAHARAHALDDDARLTGAVNTLLLGEEIHGFNTDVGGLTSALLAAGLAQVRTARVLGGGATARSALVSLLRLGVDEVELRTRRPEQAEELAGFAQRIGLKATTNELGSGSPPPSVDLTVSTLPGSAALPDDVMTVLAREGGALFSAAYAPWPTPLAQAWTDAPVLTGLEMLLHQAVAQIRIFLNGAPDAALPDEPAVLGVMRAALR
ncbi:shikimate dehydrogenase family protein [Microbacterium sp. 2MCAF23]|uniref:shikimate dehydrogenase family protein n=1 Tax=Microbacterium sp. 2MCAF23 TaxID=3232985 RepID=UPI003F9BBEA9